jgi:2-oxoglutarate ferredoxin oxidoreductase subunit beta
MAFETATVQNKSTEGPFKVADYKTEAHNDWCPGCGDFGILSAIQLTLADMQIAPHRVAVFAGIGCSSKTPHFINSYGIHTLHGRSLPFAVGAKLANPELTVIATGGDGDGLGIGVGHFVNAGRRNVDFTYILFDNGVYGLTKGQASPTLRLGVKTKSLPQPNINEGINSLLLALAAGFTFIARGYAYDVKHLRELIRMGVEHKGSAYINVLQPCPTYNDIMTKDWFGGEDRKDEQTGKSLPRVYKLNQNGYDPYLGKNAGDAEIQTKVGQFMAKAMEWGDHIPVGVFLKNETVPSYDMRIAERIKNYFDAAPARRTIADAEGKPTADLTAFFEELRVT